MYQLQVCIQVTLLIPLLTGICQGYPSRTSTLLGVEVWALRESRTRLEVPHEMDLRLTVFVTPTLYSSHQGGS